MHSCARQWMCTQVAAAAAASKPSSHSRRRRRRRRKMRLLILVCVCSAFTVYARACNMILHESTMQKCPAGPIDGDAARPTAPATECAVLLALHVACDDDDDDVDASDERVLMLLTSSMRSRLYCLFCTRRVLWCRLWCNFGRFACRSHVHNSGAYAGIFSFFKSFFLYKSIYL